MRISDWSSDVCSSDLVLVHMADHDGDHSRPLFQFAQDLPLALAAVAQHAAHELPGLGDGGAVSGIINAILALIELGEAGHIGGHVAVGRRSEEHTSEVQSLMRNSYAVFCMKKKHYS